MNNIYNGTILLTARKWFWCNDYAFVFLKKIENQWINKASQEKKMPDCYSKDSKKRKGGNPSFIHIIPTFNHMLS